MLSLSDVLETSQVLSVHLPNTAATRNLLDAAKLALLPEGAYLINVGRGEVVDEEALADAIESGRLGGAGLDVRQQEPPTLGRLEKLANVIVTHTSRASRRRRRRGLLGVCVNRSTWSCPAAPRPQRSATTPCPNWWRHNETDVR